MSLSFLAAAAAALVAAVVTGMLVRRCARMPRLDLIAWVLAAAGLTIALAAQALGYHQGFNPTSFRLVEVGARLVAPLALVWGLAELTGRTFWARFGSRLVLGALTVITGVILAADPLSGVTFTTAWPSASAHYQLIPNLALVVLAVVTALAGPDRADRGRGAGATPAGVAGAVSRGARRGGGGPADRRAAGDAAHQARLPGAVPDRRRAHLVRGAAVRGGAAGGPARRGRARRGHRQLGQPVCRRHRL